MIKLTGRISQSCSIEHFNFKRILKIPHSAGALMLKYFQNNAFKELIQHYSPSDYEILSMF
ncbi:CGH_1_HP_G0102980.mRNA.1.CDS.1 [Saccharomyces cerevisiae]|nr:CGH_1_HP_G0102980.mRNA.1.CDS.1 [Saccharomyces cerevisiae]CAI6950107.1 CGH_1_HP_G0102980.mRNA.1.CDS.1 [Saccharomyces cerevisiae]